MKKLALILTFISLIASPYFLFSPTSLEAQGEAPLRIKEVDESPDIKGVREIRVPNGSLTQVAGGIASIATNPSLGGTITGGTVGSILFVDTGPVIAQDNSNFFWDDTNNRLGLGTTTPSSEIHILRSSWSPAASTNDLVTWNATRTNSSTAVVLEMSLTNTGGGFSNIFTIANSATTANVSSMNSFSLTSSVIGVEATTQVFGVTSNVFLQSGGDTPSAAAYSGFTLQNNAGAASGVLRGVLIDATLSAGTVTEYRGIEIGTFTLGATITDSSAIKIDNTIPSSDVSKHFAIQSLSVAPSLLTGLLRYSAVTFSATATTPAQLTGNQNDYNPGGRSWLQRWSSDASRNVTSLTFTVAQEDGQSHCICNIGAQNIVLTHDDGATGTAANRFKLVGAANRTIAPDECVIVVYDATTARWRAN